MDMTSTLNQLENKNETLIRLRKEYNAEFKTMLETFVKDNNFDKPVQRTGEKKTENGMMSIVDGSDTGGYRGNPAIPYYFVFHPYRNNGELSAAHRADKFDVASAGEYIAKVLETYTVIKE